MAESADSFSFYDLVQTANVNMNTDWRYENEGHLGERRAVVALILNMLNADCAPAYDIGHLVTRNDMVQMAQRLEYLLFQRASSIHEYLLPSTLPRRLQKNLHIRRQSGSTHARSLQHRN